MSKSLYTLLIIISFGFSQTANASFINILYDHTDAFAQVTYDPGVVSNPGTTLDTFSGALFPSAVFGGYDLSGDRSATIPIPGTEFADTTDYSARNNAGIFFGFYRFVVNLGTSAPSQYGATGSASAETDLNLRFQVTDGNSLMDLFAAYEGNAPVQLILYDETLGVTVENLAPTTFSQDSANGVVLYDNHIYSLTGSLYAFTPLSGDPSSNFGFRFEDGLVLAGVPEPGALTLMLAGLIGLGMFRFGKKS
ncbi:MAG: hypothetical protein KZQ75_06335 [Candidatus Thiodiazotropha sp. (ex Myrtea spinifera)]|nr:hypothetical protein [Candidatus Thiodiazotropha sp. (ex Myrtea spinifera)]